MKYLINLRKTRDGIAVTVEAGLTKDPSELSPKSLAEVQLMGTYLADAAKAWITMSPEDRVAYQQRQPLSHTAH